MRSIRFLAALILLAISGRAMAAGSVAFAQADAILKESPAIRAYLVDTLCISKGGMAPRLNGEYPLGGERVGPYTFYVLPKNDLHARPFALKIVTTAKLYDAAGKRIGDEDWGHAERIEEHFASIELTPARERMPELETANCAGLR